MPKAMQMYSPNPAADALAARLIRFLLIAGLLAPLVSSCATSLAATDGPNMERATPTRLIARK